jgi:hypothetical protein
MNSVLKEMMNGAATNNLDEFELGMTLWALLQMLTDDDEHFDPALFDYFVEVKGPGALEYWKAKYGDEVDALTTERESVDNGE